MRSKSARSEKVSKSTDSSSKIIKPEPYHENPFLKLLKTSKKDKQHEKSTSFHNLIALSNLSGISKSALRRRKRKAREQLKPQMNDLLSTIAAEVPRNDDEPKFIASTKGRDNAPNAVKRSGRNVIMRQEHEKFNHVLQNPTFKTSPFAALKEAIANNMKTGQ